MANKTGSPWIQFPAGIPTYLFKHALRVRPAGRPAIPLVFDDFDLVWILRGRIGLHFDSGIRTVLRAGDLALIPPFQPLVMSGKSHGTQTFWFCHFKFRLQSIRQRGQDSDFSPVQVPMKFTARAAPRVVEAYRRLNRERDKRPSPWRLEALLISLVDELAQFGLTTQHSCRTWSILSKDGGRLRQTPDARIAMLRQQIDALPGRSWTIEELARMADLSLSHLHHLCRRTLGKPLKRYLLEKRLGYALELLQRNDMGERSTILQISRAAGYSSQHYFCRQFKAFFGVTPLACRKAVNMENLG
jgi:AraC-like DNA-binding protein